MSRLSNFYAMVSSYTDNEDDEKILNIADEVTKAMNDMESFIDPSGYKTKKEYSDAMEEFYGSDVITYHDRSAFSSAYDDIIESYSDDISIDEFSDEYKDTIINNCIDIISDEDTYRNIVEDQIGRYVELYKNDLDEDESIFDDVEDNDFHDPDELTETLDNYVEDEDEE